jgi:hypothetical protein
MPLVSVTSTRPSETGCTGARAILSRGMGTVPRSRRRAQHARVGVPVAAIRFPANLVDVPSTWRLDSVAFSPEAGVDVATRYEITNGAAILPPAAVATPDNSITATINPAPRSSSCSFVGGTPVPRVIHGYHVLVDQIESPALWHQMLCAKMQEGCRCTSF